MCTFRRFLRLVLFLISPRTHHHFHRGSHVIHWLTLTSSLLLQSAAWFCFLSSCCQEVTPLKSSPPARWWVSSANWPVSADLLAFCIPAVPLRWPSWSELQMLDRARSHSGGKRAFLLPWNFMEEHVSGDERLQDLVENGSRELGESERPSSKFCPRSAGYSSASPTVCHSGRSVS